LFLGDVAIVSCVLRNRRRMGLFAGSPMLSLFNCQTANAPPARSDWGRAPLGPLPLPRRGEQSADRRWCGSAAPDDPLSRVDPSPGSPRDDRPMTRAGAPLGALQRLSAPPLGRCLSSGPRLRVPAIRPGRQRAPRTPAVVPAGRVPKPPGWQADEAHRAGAAQAEPPGPPRDRLPDLRPRLPLAPSNQRHRLTPLDEQGA
jgi:hypothetical protein